MNFHFDEFAYRHRYTIFYGLIGCIVICLFKAAFSDPSKWMNSAGLISDLTGIVQLEVSGVFEGLVAAALEHEKQTGNLPSRFVREIIATPDEDQTQFGRFEDWLKTSPKAGVAFIALGCVLQLVATWMS